MGTSLHALAATYALSRIGRLKRSNIHLASTGTHTALGTLVRIHPVTVDADAVKQSVKCTQGADVSAKGAENHHGK